MKSLLFLLGTLLSQIGYSSEAPTVSSPQFLAGAEFEIKSTLLTNLMPFLDWDAISQAIKVPSGPGKKNLRQLSPNQQIQIFEGSYLSESNHHNALPLPISSAVESSQAEALSAFEVFLDGRVGMLLAGL